MNQQSNRDTEAIRSDIDQTRRRMDDTMDALGNRLQGRHLVDEILGFFRGSGSNPDGVGQKLKDSAQGAVHSVVDSVKANPMPVLVIGAGLAWLIYEKRKGAEFPVDDDQAGSASDPDFSASATATYDPDAYVDRPLVYPTPAVSGVGAKISEVKNGIADKAASVTGQAKEKMGEVADKARRGLENVRQRAGEVGNRAKERTREVYEKSRERVVTTANQHPLELGLACLAVGLIAGLAMPTPDRVNRMAGAKMDRLRQRTKEAGSEILQKGRRVAEVAAEAGRHEAQEQGFGLDALRTQPPEGADQTHLPDGTPAEREAGEDENRHLAAQPSPSQNGIRDRDSNSDEPPRT